MRSRLISIVLLVFLALSLIAGISLIFHAQEEEISWRPAVIAREGIGVVRIHGPIFTDASEGMFKTVRGAGYYVNRIGELLRDRRVKAIVIRVDSPGGSIGAVQELYAAILKAREKKPIIISMGDIATSGGLYISAAACYIMANPGTITGSIGVAVGNINFHRLMQEHGIGMEVIKSGEHKDILSAWREMSEEERELLQALVDELHLQFVNAVAAGRDIDIDRVKEIADGRIFTGTEAMRLGFVDRLGGFSEAIDVAMEKAGLEGEPVIIEKERPFWERMFPGASGGDGVSRLLRQIEDSHLPVKFIYHFPLGI
ncbi:MAG: putative signal peptide peptidase SppA [Syntrophomonadaceae bacterium]|nr:putative signal peptide peptidase SppA [Bacillota bacterium]